MIKLLSLPEGTMLAIGDDAIKVVSKKDYLTDRSYYPGEVCIAESYTACLDAESILENAIENEGCDNMYEDWTQNIWSDITKDDIADIQAILNRILARDPSSNIAWHSGEAVEIDT